MRTKRKNYTRDVVIRQLIETTNFMKQKNKAMDKNEIMLGVILSSNLTEMYLEVLCELGVIYIEEFNENEKVMYRINQSLID